MKLLSFVLVSLFSLQVIAADPPTTTATEHKAPTAAEQAEWMKYSTPGDGHKVLNDLAGTFKYTAKFWMAPNTKEETMTGTSTNKWTLGGRFLTQTVAGKAHGQPFNGVGTIGFDSLRNQYQSTWMDTMSTHMMVSNGTWDASSKTLTETGEFSCAMTQNKNRWFRTEMKINDKKSHTYAMFNKDAEGKEFKAMEIEYTRTK